MGSLVSPDGTELGIANDIVFGKHNSKQDEG